MRTLAYYGGSFDPPHSGHQRVVLEALVHSGADEVWVAPAYTHADGKSMAPYNDRVAMCHELIRPFKNYEVTVSRVEERMCSRGGKGLTADVIEYLTDGSNGSFGKVLLVGGSDVAKALPTWEGFDRLLKLQGEGKLDFFLVKRDPDDVSSREIRRALKHGLTYNVVDRIMPPGVLSYITRYSLYKE